MAASLPSELLRRKTAASLHFVLVLTLLGILAYWGASHAREWRSTQSPDRIPRYMRTIVQEWLILGIVLLGVRRSGSSIFTVLGERWRSVRQIFTDIGIGVAFLIVSVLFVSIIGPIVGMKHDNSEIQFLLPQGGREILCWFAVAISAGICEEAVYRGYLQQQFTAFTRSAALGIFLSAFIFSLEHLYQGFARAFVILLGSTLSGVLAYWRRTVRPGMVAHVLQDLLPLLIHR